MCGTSPSVRTTCTSSVRPSRLHDSVSTSARIRSGGLSTVVAVGVCVIVGRGDAVGVEVAAAVGLAVIDGDTVLLGVAVDDALAVGLGAGAGGEESLSPQPAVARQG